MTTAVYYRVSTEDQTLSMQETSISEWFARNDPSCDPALYTDMAMSGAKNDRPDFMRLMRDCEKGDISRVIVYKLDRLTRDALTGIKTLIRLDELGIEFISVSQPMLSSGTPFRHAIIAIFAELAQMERETIRERVRAGIVAARARGSRFGRPSRLTPEVLSAARGLRDSGCSLRAIAESLDLSVGAVHKALRQPLS